MTARDLMELIKRIPDFKVIFDTKEKNIFLVIDELAELAKESGVDFYDRFIIQFYYQSDYEKLESYPFKELWFTNYKAKYDAVSIMNYYGADDRVTTIVMNQTDFMIKSSFCRVKGKKIAVHTINDLSLAEFYAERGADFIYSDDIL